MGESSPFRRGLLGGRVKFRNRGGNKRIYPGHAIMEVLKDYKFFYAYP